MEGYKGISFTPTRTNSLEDYTNTINTYSQGLALVEEAIDGLKKKPVGARWNYDDPDISSCLHANEEAAKVVKQQQDMLKEACQRVHQDLDRLRSSYVKLLDRFEILQMNVVTHEQHTERLRQQVRSLRHQRAQTSEARAEASSFWHLQFASLNAAYDFAEARATLVILKRMKERSRRRCESVFGRIQDGRLDAEHWLDMHESCETQMQYLIDQNKWIASAVEADDEERMERSEDVGEESTKSFQNP